MTVKMQELWRTFYFFVVQKLYDPQGLALEQLDTRMSLQCQSSKVHDVMWMQLGIQQSMLL